MQVTDIRKVCVIGAGLMGKQIALNTALHDFNVALYDSFPNALEKAGIWKSDFE